MGTLIEIPAKFAEDHHDRDLPSGKLVNRGKKLWTFECSRGELEEWLSDAEYYSDCAGRGWDIGPDAIGLQSSARATARRVRAILGVGKPHSFIAPNGKSYFSL